VGPPPYDLMHDPRMSGVHGCSSARLEPRGPLRAHLAKAKAPGDEGQCISSWVGCSNTIRGCSGAGWAAAEQ
jgi:hypothetical protein